MVTFRQAAAGIALAASIAVGVNAKVIPKESLVVDLSDPSSLSANIDKPSFKLEKENGKKGQSFIEVTHTDTNPSKVTRTSDGKVEMDMGNRKHRFYNVSEGFEYEIEYASRPISNIEVLDLNLSDDLYVTYQPPLTEEEKKRMDRPDNVVGSYAVFWKEGKQPEGQPHKFGHIYRPQLIDANGDKKWADMKIEKGLLTIKMPSKWLDDAVYPVILDPTFGKTNVGATTNSLPADYIEGYGTYTPATSGTLTSMSLYTTLAAGVFKFAVYSDVAGAPSALLGVSAEQNGAVEDWVTGAITTPFAVTAGTPYWLAFKVGTLVTSKADNDGGVSGCYTTAGGLYAAAGPDPFTSCTTEAPIDSLYANYTASTGGSSPIIIFLSYLKSFIPFVYAR